MYLYVLCRKFAAIAILWHLKNGGRLFTKTSPVSTNEPWVRKLLLIMKLVTILLFFAAMHVSANGIAQITISESQISLQKVFKKMHRQSGYDFLYNSELVRQNGKVSIDVRNVSLEEALDKCLSGKSLTYRIVERTVVIKQKLQVEKEQPRPMVQDIEVSGRITDTTGVPLAGVSVYVKGNTSSGTTTDLHGRYILKVPDNSVLVFSMVGFDSQEISINGNRSIDVTLRASSDMLEETVVVAFGRKQLKEATVGAVTSVSGKDLKVPSSNLTTALAGRISGIISYQRSGEPGENNANFFIRGISTFGQGNSPLILVDNIEVMSDDLARMQPDDIESFSVLKDASATSLYGARAANGVIFITTKEGKEGRVKINVRSELSMSAPTREIETVGPVTYMKLYDEAQLTRDPLAAPKYSQNQIDHTIAGDNPFVYPVIDWKEMLIKDYAFTQRNNISMSGGGKVAQYYVAGTFNIDNGILKVDKRNNFNNNIKLKTYQLRSNVTINVTPITRATVRLYGNFDEYTGPIVGGGATYRNILQTSPASYPAYYLPDSAHRSTNHILFGNYDDGTDKQYINPYADLVKGYKEYSQSKMLAQLELDQKLDFVTPGLSARMILSTDRYSYFEATRAYNPHYYNIASYDRASDTYVLNWLNQNSKPTEYLNYNASIPSVSTHLYMLLGADYSRSWGKQTIGGSLISTIQQTQSPKAGVVLQESLPHRNMGLSGRVAYNYDRRYYTEFSFGYNGSERFSRNKQFGFFPTVGAAWVVSNENFWKDKNVSNAISRLKIRGSFGLVGNDAIGAATDRFFYLSEVNMDNPSFGFSTGFNQNDYRRDGISTSRYENFDITWEKSYQTNIAVELTILNKLNIIADLYKQKRTNILQSRNNVPATMGLAAVPMANLGVVESSGIDLTMEYTQHLGKDGWIQGRANFTFSGGRFLEYEEPDYPENESYRNIVGSFLGVQRGYIAERLFIDEKDVLSSPIQNFGRYEAGDIKYRDINGDGVITSADMVPLGYPNTPQIIYGFGFSAGYKNFDFSAFFQGLARESFWIDAVATSPFVNLNAGIAGTPTGENAMLAAYAESYWSEDNRDIYAVWPRLSITNINNNTVRNSWFVRHNSFLRLKSAEIGYTFSEKLLSRRKITGLRLYLSGTNLMCFSAFKLWDPEMGGNGLGYPLQRVLNVGININF